ncbi:hypothetical protein [Adlercreutzia sp. ZJ473]|uniref:alginate O-acetyltransferase AlgX-related protein n=1 Tax=Adlercreutzia sp. ZJ473 TaxID=2722822 RepID=UPI00155392B7|nr:hypothetical protein [Adlercreutzia sp. ZJ473]
MSELFQGKGGEGSRRRVLQLGFVVLVLAVLLVPLVAIPFAPVDEEAELQELSPWPKLVEDGKLNVDYLSEAGACFDDHFAFRQQLMTANALVQSKLFGTSPTDQVVVGTDGWLYYGSTLADYQRSDVMGECMADNAAYNLALMQEYVEGCGAEFVFTIAPNKNSVAAEHMPYYLLEGEGMRSADVLRAKLVERGVSYVDLFEPLSHDGASLFMRTDTHWNGEGALIAYDSIMDALGKDHEDYRNAASFIDGEFVGDLERMLLPLCPEPEDFEVYEASQRFSYANDADAATDAFICTKSDVPSSEGALLMYRDSFGNALLPFFATEFERACFSKMIPYNLADLKEQGASCVVVERAERHIDFFATDPAIFPAPVRAVSKPVRSIPSDATIAAKENGPYLQVEGELDPRYAAFGSKVYLVVTGEAQEGVWYEASRMSIVQDESVNDFGYRAYLDKSALPTENKVVRLIVDSGDAVVELSQLSIEGDQE